MKTDLTTSTVTIGERRFPAVGLVCPEEMEPPSRGRWDRILGGPSEATEQFPHENTSVYVPLENGLLVNVETGRLGTAGEGLHVMLWSRTCEISRHHTSDEWLWAPIMMAKVGKTITRNELPPPNRLRLPYPVNLWSWHDAEEDWVAEHLDRLARCEVVMPEGPLVELIRLDELWALCAEGYENRASV